MNIDEIRKLLKEKYDFEAPDWWECQWRRLPCNRPECPLCGRLMKQRFKHQFKGEDPDSMEAGIEDIGDSLAETMMMLRQDAERFGIDLNAIPEGETESPPEEFPISKKATGWLLRFHEFAKRTGGEWADTEAGQDLMWYANYIPPKAYRALCSVWRFDKGQIDEKIDYEYTKYVLEECVRIAKEAFAILISMPLDCGKEFSALYLRFLEVEEDVLSI